MLSPLFFFFFNDTATTEIYTLSLHDALPILEFPLGWYLDVARPPAGDTVSPHAPHHPGCRRRRGEGALELRGRGPHKVRSEEHTSELQSRQYLVCRLLLEKKKIPILEALYLN